jgi:hypothetical protein
VATRSARARAVRVARYVRRVGGPASALLALATFACSEDPPRETSPRERIEREETQPAQIDPAYEAIEVDDPGSIAGDVRWLGERPVIEMLPVRMHQAACGSEQPSPALLVSARGGVADAVVSIENVRSGVAPAEPQTPPEMVIRDCAFVPHVMAMGQNARVAFRNESSLLENVRVMRGDRTEWDFALPELGATQRRRAGSPGALHVVDDVHTWMGAWIHVFAHPYFAVTDAEGHFRLDSVPAGQYIVRVWHEGWRVVGAQSGRPRYSSAVILTRTVGVSPRQETTADFELGTEAGEAAGE